MSDIQDKKSAASSKLMHYGMMACCAVMLLPVMAFFVAGGTVAGLWGNYGLFILLAFGLGAHVVMFKVMGKSCHGSKKEQAHENTVNAQFEHDLVPVRIHEVARPR